MSTKPSPSALKKRDEESETLLRRSLRVAGLPAVVKPKESETSEPSRSTLEVSAPSAEAEASHRSEDKPIAEPEAPPMPENVVPSLSLPEMEPSAAGQCDEVGAQRGTRTVEGQNQVVPAEHQNIASQGEFKASTAISLPLSANPELTAANPHSSQVEDGVLSLLEVVRCS